MMEGYIGTEHAYVQMYECRNGEITVHTYSKPKMYDFRDLGGYTVTLVTEIWFRDGQRPITVHGMKARAMFRHYDPVIAAGLWEPHPVRVLMPDDDARDRTKCGTCLREWDDAIVTEYTPAPSGRCPFEYYH